MGTGEAGMVFQDRNRWHGQVPCYRFERAFRSMRVELLGIPRERAGVSVVELQADTLGQLLALLVGRFLRLADVISSSGFASSIVANINGDRFVTDPLTPLRQDDCVLILSADAGG